MRTRENIDMIVIPNITKYFHSISDSGIVINFCNYRIDSDDDFGDVVRLLDKDNLVIGSLYFEKAEQFIKQKDKLEG